MCFRGNAIIGWITLIHLSGSAAFLSIGTPRPLLHKTPVIEQRRSQWVLEQEQKSLFHFALASKSKGGGNNDQGQTVSIIDRFKSRAAIFMSSIQTTVNHWRRSLSKVNILHDASQSHNAQRIDWNETNTTAPPESLDPSQSLKEMLPEGARWEVSHPDVDLSGTWKPIITPQFLKEYDEYLKNCGASYFFRQLCLKFCSTTRETITQSEDGRTLELDGKTPAGGWKRSLISSGASVASPQYQVAYAEFLDPDKEQVQVEAWWEDEGRVHRSILRNKLSVGGGEFETLRCLASKNGNTGEGKHGDTSMDQDVLITESIFHPSETTTSNSKFKPTRVRWEYSRML